MIVRRMIIYDNLTSFLKRKPSELKILDFGCGSGFFVEELSKKGYQSSGIDISEEAVKFGRLQGIKNIGVIDSHKIDSPDNSLDAVFALSVLEHLEDERWALKEIERVLRPGGIAIIVAPAYMFLWGVQDEAAHHYRRYTLGTLMKKIKESTSLRVLRSSYFNTILFAPIMLVRLFTKLTGIKGRDSDFDINNPFLNKVFFSVFNAERKILKKINFPFGVSILAVLEKPKESRK